MAQLLKQGNKMNSNYRRQIILVCLRFEEQHAVVTFNWFLSPFEYIACQLASLSTFVKIICIPLPHSQTPLDCHSHPPLHASSFIILMLMALPPHAPHKIFLESYIYGRTKYVIIILTTFFLSTFYTLIKISVKMYCVVDLLV